MRERTKGRMPMPGRRNLWTAPFFEGGRQEGGREGWEEKKERKQGVGPKRPDRGEKNTDSAREPVPFIRQLRMSLFERHRRPALLLADIDLHHAHPPIFGRA